jgi:RNA polymerase sigma factor (sigma-70 family)
MALTKDGESKSVTGDDVGFAELYEPLRRFASVVGSLDMDADDLVQEALVRTLALQPLADLDDPAAYLRTVIVRLASNERRSAGRRRRALLRLRREPEHVTVEYPSDLAVLAHLEPHDRAAVYLAVVERRSHREIAEMLGCTEEASRQRVARSLAKLQSEIAAEAERG